MREERGGYLGLKMREREEEEGLKGTTSGTKPTEWSLSPLFLKGVEGEGEG